MYQRRAVVLRFSACTFAHAESSSKAIQMGQVDGSQIGRGRSPPMTMTAGVSCERKHQQSNCEASLTPLDSRCNRILFAEGDKISERGTGQGTKPRRQLTSGTLSLA
jgi:hypothetical protein